MDKPSWTNYSVDIRVENLVYTCNLKVALNLMFVCQELNKRGYGVVYNPKKFASIIMRYRVSPRNQTKQSTDSRWELESRNNSIMRHYLHHTKPASQRLTEIKRPKIAVLISSPGKIVCTGAKMASQARYVIENMVSFLQGIGYTDAKITHFNVENMVGSVRLPGEIWPDKLAETYPAYCTYDPEQFPGAILRYPPIKPMTVLVFRSGKLVITGAKSLEGAREAFSKVYPILSEFAVEKGIERRPDPYVKSTRDINEDVSEYVDGLMEKMMEEAENERRRNTESQLERENEHTRVELPVKKEQREPMEIENMPILTQTTTK